MNTDQLQWHCWNRCVKVYVETFHQLPVFYQHQCENILFLCGYWLKSMPQNVDIQHYKKTWVRMLDLYVENMSSSSYSTEVLFATETVLTDIVSLTPHLTDTLRRHVQTSTTQPFSLDALTQCVHQKQYSDATSLYTIGWIDASVGRVPDHVDTICGTGISLSTQLMSQYPSLGFKRDSLTQSHEQMVYFVTHVLFTLTKWGTDCNDMERLFRSMPEVRLAWFGAMVKWCGDLMINESVVKHNLEVLTEVAICILLVAPSAETSVHANVQQLARFLLERNAPTAATGMAFLPNDDPKYYGKEYFYHCDYHTHMLIGLFISLYSNTCSRPRSNGITLGQDLNSAATFYIGTRAIKCVPMVDSTELLANGSNEQLASRLETDGYLWLRHVLLAEKDGINPALHAIQRHINKKKRKSRGWLVEVDGYVHDEREHENKFVGWTKVLTQPKVQMLYKDNKRLHRVWDAVLGPRYTHMMDQTWFRIKMPGEYSRLHADYYHFLQAGTMFTQNTTAKYGSSTAGDPRQHLKCDLCHRLYGIETLTDAVLPREGQVEWHCMQCSNAPIQGYTTWIPLQPLRAQQGVLAVLPGSHRADGFEAMDDDGVLPRKFVDNMDQQADQQVWHLPFYIEAGDIILFNIKLIHGAVNTQTTEHARFSCDTRVVIR